MVEIDLRRAVPGDRDAIVGLLARTMGWDDAERDLGYFAWKHDLNPFGPSPMWVASAGDDVVALRAMMRWELHGPGGSLRLVRAVDTATDPDLQGRGLFRDLTLTAIDALRADGVDAVFNTPNSESKPGYLKMGWRELGRPALAVLPGRRPGAMLRAARTRAGATRWGLPVDAGDPASVALTGAGIDDLLRSLPAPTGWATPLTAGYLGWRYGFEPLGYRVVDVDGGVCVFRVRDRAGAREVVIDEWLSPSADRRALRGLVRRCGDYGIGMRLGPRRHGALPVPRQGPTTTWRPLASDQVPTLDDLHLTLGDLELF